MAITNENNRNQYTANGVITSFAYTFKITDASHIAVYEDGVLVGSGFTVAGVGDAAGGTVDYSVAPANLVKITLLLNVPVTQPTVYPIGSKFPASAHEGALDNIVRQNQQQQELLDRTLTWPVTVDSASAVLPDPDTTTNQGKAIFIKSDGSGLETRTIGDADMQSVLTAKKQLLVHDGTNADKITGTADGQVPVIDAAENTGWKMVAGIATRAGLWTKNAAGYAELVPASTSHELAFDSADLVWSQKPWAQGQCALNKVSANLVLTPKNGNIVILKTGSNWAVHQVPEAGVSLAASALSVDTNYYIYLYNNAGTLTLEASTTVPARDTTTGFQIKTSDATRLLVGFARTITGPAWVDSTTQRFVRSWFHDGGIHCLGEFSTNRTTTSASFAVVNTESDVNFLTWGSETVEVTATGAWSSSADAQSGLTVAINSSAFDRGVVLRRLNGTVTGQTDYHFYHLYDQASAGKHTCSIFAKTSTGTLTLVGAAGGDGTAALRILIPPRS